MGLLLAGCSSLGTSGAAHQPNAQLANAYLASGATWVNYIQWNTSGVGTFTAGLHLRPEQSGNDVTTANSGLGTVKSDGNGHGPDCSNADTVESDFDEVASDSDSFSGDLDGFTSRVSGARQAISTLQSDLSGLSAANLPAPSGASAAISSAKGAISSAISTTNGDISKVNGDVLDAAQVPSSLATGSCSNIGIPKHAESGTHGQLSGVCRPPVGLAQVWVLSSTTISWAIATTTRTIQRWSASAVGWSSVSRGPGEATGCAM